MKNHNLGGVIDRSCKGCKHVAQKLMAMRSKYANSVLLKYMHCADGALCRGVTYDS